MRASVVGAMTVTLAVLAGATPARATEREVVAPASGKQRALAVALVEGAVLSSVCEEGQARCDAKEGAKLVPPESARASLAGASVRAVRLSSGRHVAIVTAPREGGAWSLVLAAPPTGGGEANIVWSGTTGRPRGASGDRAEHRLEVTAQGGGARVVLTSRREELSVCGREAFTGARAVDPETLELSPIAAADPLPVLDPPARALDVRVLPTSEVGATPARALSALAGSRPGFAALVDGDVATGWRPEVPGEATFETVTFVAAPELPLEALEIRFAPPTGSDRAAARGLRVATPESVATIRTDEVVTASGLVLRATFPTPVRTRCLAIVLDAPGRRGGPPATLVEIVARTTYDTLAPDQVARGLGGPDGVARAAWLARAGEAGWTAVSAAYPLLDGQGQDLARRVIDAQDCGKKAPFYAGELRSADEEARRRAVDRLSRCGDAAVPAILARSVDASPAEAMALVDTLALASPEAAIADIVTRLSASPDATTRSALRSVLARASRRAKAAEALQRALAPAAFGATPPGAQLDLLRATAPRLATVTGGREAFRSAAARGDFATRYLLAAPASELARGGDEGAGAWLLGAIASDPDPRVRARATRAAGRVPAAMSAIAAAARDPEPRVREAAGAALGALGEEAPAAVREGEAARSNAALAGLVADEWTFVREVAAASAAAWPRARATDVVLAKAAAADANVRVRRVAMRSLGARGASEHAPLLRARAAAGKEDLDVRAEAHRALGAMCDRASVDLWTELAQKAITPFSEGDRKLGAAAVDALASAHPPDLAARLAPLLATDAPREVKEHAARALAHKGRCPR